jgi:hypothetical protein
MEKQLNFEVRTKSFKAGFYTLENFNGLPTYWLVYENTSKNTTRINNSGLMLTLFKELPINATINAHKK